MVQAEVRQQEDEMQKGRAVNLETQGMWTKWDLPKRKGTKVGDESWTGQEAEFPTYCPDNFEA